MKLPRDLSAENLVKALASYGYDRTRQSGSHIRLTRISHGKEHNITIPEHQPVKVGTLSAIIKDIARHLEKEPSELIKELFG